MKGQERLSKWILAVLGVQAMILMDLKLLKMFWNKPTFELKDGNFIIHTTLSTEPVSKKVLLNPTGKSSQASRKMCSTRKWQYTILAWYSQLIKVDEWESCKNIMDKFCDGERW
ncbi:MAG: hypothetical protein ACLTDP_12980 [Terrisporobacter sp.]